MKIVRIVRLVSRFWPVAEEIIEAVDKASEGGRRVTPSEWRQIADVALRRARAVLNEIGAELVA